LVTHARVSNIFLFRCSSARARLLRAHHACDAFKQRAMFTTDGTVKSITFDATAAVFALLCLRPRTRVTQSSSEEFTVISKASNDIYIRRPQPP
jgi:hypothetical protein